jgi:FAD:protein FMN transferase
MKVFTVRQKLMGSAFELAVVQENETKAEELLQLGIAEIIRIEKLLSEFLPDSETSRINRHHWHEPLPVEPECFDLIARCLRISALSHGCFDITVSPLKKLYRFQNTQFEMPPADLIKETLKQTGYKKIQLHPQNHSLFTENKYLKISFSAIGKGYASDRVKKLWQQAGLESGFINASGDLNAFGLKPDGAPWKIGIAHPDNPGQILLYIPLENASAATSGDYEQFFIHKNIRYSHNIHPNTGLPMTGIKSVSVFSPSAELSDALATAVYVMGKYEGILFVNQLPQTYSVIIDEKNKIYLSDNLQYEEASL